MAEQKRDPILPRVVRSRLPACVRLLVYYLESDTRDSGPARITHRSRQFGSGLMLRGAVIFAMDKIRQIRAGQKVDSNAVLETLGRQLSEARATNEELFAGMVAPELVVSGPPECS